MKAKHIPFAAALILAASLAACSHPVVNLNAPQVAENQSHIYTLVVNARINPLNMVQGSLKAYVVVEGQEHEMQLAPYGEDIYQYDYHMPSDRSEAKYYFVIRYDEMLDSLVKHREWKSPQVYTLKVMNRYVLQMEMTRGVVGSVVPVVGNGFLPQDYIVIGGTAAPTKYASTNALTFQVPPLPPGDYPVEWHSGSDVFQLGAFHIDLTNFKVSPASLEVASTESTNLTISIDQPAPYGDLPITVLTDAPASVVMDTVRIPAGESSVTVKITGGQPGSGNLRISTPGFNMVTVPIKVDDAPPPPPTPVTPVAPEVTPAEPAPAPAAAVTPVTPEPTPAPAPAPEPAPVIRGS